MTKKNYLKSLLIQIFKKIKQAVKPFKNPLVVNYHEKFFSDFSPSVLSSNYLFNQGNVELTLIKPFNQVSNLESFKDYLNSIPGLYPRLVLWAIKHPFPNGTSTIPIKHHVMPKFLTKNEFKFHGMKTVLEPKQIEAKYNIIKTSFVIHLVMHLVRFLEYHQFGDFLALQVLLDKPNKFLSKTSFFDELSINKQLKFVFDHCFLPGYLIYDPELKKRLPEKTNSEK